MAKACHALAPDLYIWESNTLAYEAGWFQKGIVGPAQLCPGGFLYETPDQPIFREYWDRSGTASSSKPCSTPRRAGWTAFRRVSAGGVRRTRHARSTSPTGAKPSSVGDHARPATR